MADSLRKSSRLKSKTLFKLNVGNEEFDFNKADPVDFNRLVRVPTYRWCYERYYTILEDRPNNERGRKEDALVQLSKELIEVYFYCNLYPETKKSSIKNFSTRIKLLGGIRKESSRTDRSRSAAAEN